MGGISKERKNILEWTIEVKIAGYLIRTFAYFSICYFIVWINLCLTCKKIYNCTTVYLHSGTTILQLGYANPLMVA